MRDTARSVLEIHERYRKSWKRYRDILDVRYREIQERSGEILDEKSMEEIHGRYTQRDKKILDERNKEIH
jgi:hypothetical protein